MITPGIAARMRDRVGTGGRGASSAPRPRSSVTAGDRIAELLYRYNSFEHDPVSHPTSATVPHADRPRTWSSTSTSADPTDRNTIRPSATTQKK
jgi:hypothetical protein